MKFVIQRVRHASVTVDNEVIGKIGRGYMVLIGVSDADDEAIADKMVDKMIKLRINEDAEGKTNLSLADVGGELLLISQFTLYANCKKGNRPSFTEAGSPEKANALYEYIIDRCKRSVPVVEKGSFGAHMAVELLNDGPFTIVLDSEKM
ncbi:MAG: D-tyrosyl-tRNA(Tyr) deacylase [Clostridia bacterium]|nr:D-tyrosyl-tRNA(Tyr) deacylase [Clostridia bacterium]MBQ3292610.1 D-tyrosyl-tRNA(Tyr) deacylase [Mogibacterium sp.]